MRLVATSHWMEGLIRQSFLKDYPVTVLHHGIDLSVFRPAEGAPARNARRGGKVVVLGAAFTWTHAKGLDVWASLAERLDDRFRIVLAGAMPEGVTFPQNVTCLGRIGDARRLAEEFAGADVFFNPTREEALGLVNVEALACGTPVITFDTGGSPECVDPDCGVVLDQPTWEAALTVLNRMADGELVFREEACLRKAAEFDERRQLGTYLELYGRSAPEAVVRSAAH